MRSVPLTSAILLLCFIGCAEPGATADSDTRAGSNTTTEVPAGGYGSMASASGAAAAPPAQQKAAPPDEAQLNALRTRLGESPADDRLRRQLAIALLQAEQLDESIEHFTILAEQATDPGPLLELALAYSHATRSADAERTYKRLLEIAPNHHIALHNLGNLAVKQGDYEGALELYIRAITVKPDYLMAYSHLADALKGLSRFKEAYKHYERVLMLEPQNTTELELYDDALYQMASLDIKMGATERGVAMLMELIKVNPAHPKAHYALGQGLLFLGKPEAAQKEFEIHMQIQSKKKPTGAMASSE
jgi:tetratricopeptide (TPR) repeat protein